MREAIRHDDGTRVFGAVLTEYPGRAVYDVEKVQLVYRYAILE